MVYLYKKKEDGSYSYCFHANELEVDLNNIECMKSNGFVEMDPDLFEEGEDKHLYLKTDIGGVQYNKNITAYKNRLEIIELKSYLSSTDYVISKLNELKLEDDEEYEKAKTEYAEILTKRKEARTKINELEATL